MTASVTSCNCYSKKECLNPKLCAARTQLRKLLDVDEDPTCMVHGFLAHWASDQGNGNFQYSILGFMLGFPNARKLPNP